MDLTKAFYHKTSLRVFVLCAAFWIISTITVWYLSELDFELAYELDKISDLVKMTARYLPIRDPVKMSICDVGRILMQIGIFFFLSSFIVKLIYKTRKFVALCATKVIWATLIATIVAEIVIELRLIDTVQKYLVSHHWQHWAVIVLMNMFIICYGKVMLNAKEPWEDVIANILQDLLKNITLIPIVFHVLLGMFITLVIFIYELQFLTYLTHLNLYYELMDSFPCPFKSFLIVFRYLHITCAIWIVSFVWELQHFLFAYVWVNFDRNEHAGLLGPRFRSIAAAGIPNNLGLVAYGSSIMAFVDQLRPLVKKNMHFSRFTTLLFSILSGKAFTHTVYLICVKEELPFQLAAKRYYKIFSNDRNKYIYSATIFSAFLGMVKWTTVVAISMFSLSQFVDQTFGMRLCIYPNEILISAHFYLWSVYSVTTMAGIVAIDHLLGYEKYGVLDQAREHRLLPLGMRIEHV